MNRIKLWICLGIMAAVSLFMVLPAAAAGSISFCYCAIEETVVYDGSEKCPPVTVYDGGNILEYNVDYTVRYYNNVNAGYAYADITGIGEYTGTKTVSFYIQPYSPQTITVYDIKNCVYGADEPEYKVKADGVLLKKGADYYFEAPYYGGGIGENTGTVVLTGNYTGKAEFKYTVVPQAVTGVQATYAGPDSITLGWNMPYYSCSYEIYRKNGGDFVLAGRSNSSVFYDKKLRKLKKYTYRVRAYVTAGGKKIYGEFSEPFSVYTTPAVPKFTLKTGNRKAVAEIKRLKGVDGYEIFMNRTKPDYNSNNLLTGYYKRVKKYSGSKARRYTKKKLKNNRYYTFTVRAYKVLEGKKIYSPAADAQSTRSAQSRLSWARLKRKNKVKVVSTRNDVNSWTMYISAADRKIMRKFAKKRFKKNMNREEKLRTVVNYIHNRTTYIKTSAQWSKISGKSYVHAIFKQNLGQCAQYNGALAAFMAYLGYDVRLVCGYRGNGSSKWSHYWCEVKIDGLTYVMEAGNKKDGGWNHICNTYREASGYIKNGKYCR